MFDMTRNAEKSCTDILEPGEFIMGAAAVQSPGMVGRAAAANAVYSGEHVTAQSAAASANARIRNLSNQLDSATGIAVAFPAGGVLVITNRRVLVYTMDRRGHPGELVHQIPRSQVRSSVFDKGFIMDKFQLHFVDGSGRAFETGRLAKLKAVAKALDSVWV